MCRESLSFILWATSSPQTTILLSNMKQSYYLTIFLLGEVSCDYLERSVRVEIGTISWPW